MYLSVVIVIFIIISFNTQIPLIYFW